MDNCNGIPHEEFGLSQKEVHFMYNLLIESLKRSLASYPSERGTLYLFMYNL